MKKTPNIDPAASGMAALSICESLLLAMGDLKLISETEVLGIISDATDSHRNATGSSEDLALHKAVVLVLDRIVAGGNSVRRP
jgi:hypothetical protein